MGSFKSEESRTITKLEYPSGLKTNIYYKLKGETYLSAYITRKTKVLPWYNDKHAGWHVDGEKVIRKLPFEHKSHFEAAVFAWNIEKNTT